MQIMIFSYLIVAVILGVFSIPAATHPHGDPVPVDSYKFKIRAWIHPRSLIHFDFPVERDPHTGDAIVNRTANFEGVQSYVKNITKVQAGPLFYDVDAPDHKKYQAYLVPVSVPQPSNSTHYQLRFSKVGKIPRGALYSNFTTGWIQCAGNCFGYALNYGNHGIGGSWYAIPNTRPKKGKGCEGEEEVEPYVWKIRWWHQNFGPYYKPEGMLSGVNMFV